MSQQKTILYLRTDIYNQELVAGGSVTHTIGVINGFKKLGYRIVAASSIMHSQMSPLVDVLIKLSNPFWLFWLRWKLNCLISNIFFTRKILRETKNEKIDYIYQRYGILNCVGILLSKIKKIPLILEYNGSEYWVFQNWMGKGGLNLNWIVRWIENSNISRATYLVAVSEVLRQELISRGADPKKIIMAPNGVDTDFYNPALLSRERETIRAQYQIKSDTTVIGFIGTFSQWHGIELLADLIPQVLKNNEKAYFLLIGDGLLKNWLEQEIEQRIGKQSRVILTGLLPASQARMHLAACDIFLCPTQANKDGTRFFGSPTKMFEYLSMGKPIIASALEQNNDILNPALRLNNFDQDELWVNSCGILVKSDSSDEFFMALNRLFNVDQEKRNKIGKNARLRAVECFTWQKHVLQIEQFIKECHGA